MSFFSPAEAGPRARSAEETEAHGGEGAGLGRMPEKQLQMRDKTPVGGSAGRHQGVTPGTRLGFPRR